MVQGMVGFSDLSRDPLHGLDGASDLDIDRTATLPLLGAAAQYALLGERLQLGLEFGGTMGWDSHRDSVRVDSGRDAVLAVSDDDLFLCDLFVGPSGSLWVGERLRIYGGAGPLLQYAQVDLDYEDLDGNELELDGSGFGNGLYGRCGIEILIWPDSWVGFQVRWMESDIDFGSGVRDLDLDTVQFMLSASARL
jgi:hypothetical protein